MISPQEKNKKRALLSLSLTIFVLFAFPRMNFRLGPIPFYVIDVLLLTTFYYAQKVKENQKAGKLFGQIILIIFFFAIVSELFIILDLSTALQPLYIISRTALSFSLFFSIRKIIQFQEDLYPILRSALFGAIITSILVVISSIPPTRSFVNTYIFSIRFLEPASEGVVHAYSQYVGAMRGRSYVGVSILSGAFLNCVWPLLLYLRRKDFYQGYMKIAVQIISLAIPVAVIMTYSRGAIMGTVFVILGVLIFNTANFRLRLLVLIGFGLAVFLYIGLDSNYFYFKRLNQSTTRVINKPIEDRNETERLYAYVEPFSHVIENPSNFFFGLGFSRGKIGQKVDRYSLDDINYSDHAVFGKAYYAYGMISAFMYLILLYQGLLLSWRNSSKRNNPYSYQFSRVLFASLLGFIPWFAFGHAAVSTPRGSMLFFVLFALISIQSNLKSKNMTESKLEAIE